LTGFSGSGKDSVLCPLLESGKAYHVVTAVSRSRRVASNEPESAYIWMRQRNNGESEDQYYKNLVKEYSLLEHDCHYGNIYGLPLESLQKKGKGFPVVRTDISGVITLKDVLPNYDFQPISIAVMPDSWNQVYDSIINRASESEEDAMKRFLEDVGNIQRYEMNINYFLHNSRERTSDGISGLEASVNALGYLVDEYSRDI
jgi:guanylate kinase